MPEKGTDRCPKGPFRSVPRFRRDDRQESVGIRQPAHAPIRGAGRARSESPASRNRRVELNRECVGDGEMAAIIDLTVPIRSRSRRMNSNCRKAQDIGGGGEGNRGNRAPQEPGSPIGFEADQSSPRTDWQSGEITSCSGNPYDRGTFRRPILFPCRGIQSQERPHSRIGQLRK